MKDQKRRVPVIDHELAELQAKRIFEFCLVVSILALVLYFGLGNYIAGTPEPEFWLKIEAAGLAIWEAIAQ
jgi:hypothetical protein